MEEAEEEEEEEEEARAMYNDDDNDLCLTTFDVRDFAAHTIQTAARYRFAAAIASYCFC